MMEFLKHKLSYSSKSDVVNIIPLGDIHLGNINCDEGALRQLINYIAQKEETYWIGMGDYIDAITYSDTRFDPKTVSCKYLKGGDIDKIIQLQIDDLTKLFYPIKEKCLGLLRGNHEEAIRKHYHYDVIYEIAKNLDLKRDLLLYDTAIMRLNFKREKSKQSTDYDIFLSHGNMGGRTYGYKSNRIQELHKFFLADIYLVAHSHIKQAQISNTIYFDRWGRERKKKIIDAMTGCFLKGYEMNTTSYIEKKMLPPTDIGVVKIMLTPSRKDLHVSL